MGIAQTVFTVLMIFGVIVTFADILYKTYKKK